MKWSFLRYIIVTWALLMGFQVQATHIVGGEMNYRCLGNQQYEVVLTVFRDCYNGVPFFDDPASVGVFDAAGGLIANLQIPFVEDDTLKPVLTGECFVLPPNACVHTTTYRAVVTLPPSPGGYTLAYQRCCRNKTILNIVSPDSTGATFSIYISEDALAACNTSPEFKEWPPIYICVNEPIDFDHSAEDPEGDSIVYRLCTPFDGAVLGNPQPSPPFKPPYEEVVWRDPPYNLANVMGGVPLAIDPVSGLLTGVPNTIGQFVVGICADEFRDGKLISSTRRDFQYNVGICGMTVSSFASPDVHCGLTVKFENLSANADSFQWYFDVDNDLFATSNAYSPTFTYPDTGTYTVMLIAEPGDKCVDTLVRQIRVVRKGIDADFSFLFPTCKDSLALQVTDKSKDSVSMIVSWDWRLTSGSSRIHLSDKPSPSFTLDTAGVWILRLIVTSENGCRDTAQSVFPIRLATIPWPDTLWQICEGDSISLNPSSGPYNGLSYTWSPNVGLSNPSIPNPIAFPDSTITYRIISTTMSGLCRDTAFVTVNVNPPLSLIPPEDTAVCQNPFEVAGNSDRPAIWSWAADPSFTQLLGSGNPAVITVPPGGKVYVLADDQSGCVAIDSFLVVDREMNIDIVDTLVFCPDEEGNILLEILDPMDTLIAIHWEPSVNFPSGDTLNPVVFQVGAPGEYAIQVKATNQFGCSSLDTALVVVLDTSAGPEIVTASTCAGFRVRFNLLTPGAFAYEWDFGDPSSPEATGWGSETIHDYPGPGIYQVRLLVISDSGCSDTLTYELILDSPGIIPDFTWSYLTCSDTADILLKNTSILSGVGLLDQSWFVQGKSAGSGMETIWTLKGGGPLNVMLVLRAENGCVDTLTRTVDIPVIDIDLPAGLLLCPGDSQQLILGGDSSWNYLWTPSGAVSDPASGSPWVSPELTTTLQVIVSFTDPDTCVFTDSIVVQVAPDPVIETPSDTLICDSLVLLSVSVAPGTEVAWFKNIPPSLPDYFGPVIIAPVPDSLRLRIRFTDSYGCESFDSVLVNSSRIKVSLPDSAGVCYGDTLEVAAWVGGDTSGLVATWAGSGSWMSKPQDQLSVEIPSSGQPPFLITVSAVNSAGCSDFAQAWISMQVEPLIVEATADPSIILPGGSTQLSVNGEQGWSYTWEPAETLNDPSSRTPVASPLEATSYKVLVTDSYGCTNTTEVLVRLATTICKSPYIFVPNTFTPNGDGLNDLLFVRGPFVDELLFIIYDRWGNEVFRTTDRDHGWDGKFRGQILGNDVFGFYLEARCFDGELFKQKGNVTLLRN